MRVPCLCTEADYECDMNYIHKDGGRCELLPDPLSSSEQVFQSNKDEDCAIEGFYYDTQGYRKIPGNKCYGGVKLDPVKKACNSVAFITSIVNFKTIGFTVLVAACFYYGLPILEAILPKNSLEFLFSILTFVQGAMSTGFVPPQNDSRSSSANYSRNLEAQPAAFMEDDDDSEEDVGAQPNLNFD